MLRRANIRSTSPVSPDSSLAIYPPVCAESLTKSPLNSDALSHKNSATAHCHQPQQQTSCKSGPEIYSGGSHLGVKISFLGATIILLLVLTASAILPRVVDAALIDQPMTGPTAPGWILGGTPLSASLTGNGITDPLNDGWLRLTNNSGNQAGFAYFDTPISLSQGALVQFDYATWGGNGADGYTVFLFDASVPTFDIGASGGSLGYAQKTGIPGISGGYVGIGVDEYGNFADPNEGRYLGPGRTQNTVTVRGPVSSAAPPTGGTQGTQSYPWVATSPNNGPLWTNQVTRPSQTGADYRRVMMRISPAPNPVIDVWIQFGFNQPMTQMISGAAIGAAPPANLKIGYAASTGGSTNFHEIRNLTVEPSGISTSINLGVSKIASVSSITVGSLITYTVIVRNYGPNNITANGVGIVDSIPAEITGVTWNCVPTGAASCGAPSGSGNNLNTTANLPFNTAVTYTIRGTLTNYPGTTLTNTASIIIPSGITDYRSSDDSASVTITVSGSPTGSGNKPLYLYDSTSTPARKLSRTPMTVNAASFVPISRGSTTVSWSLSPVLQSDVTINSGNIPVQLWLATNSGRTYTIPITLRCGATTVASLATGTADLTGTATLFTFNLPRPTTYTCAAGNAWHLDITNAMSAGGGARDVRVYPAPAAGDFSNVKLNSQSVINVNNSDISFHSVAYPGVGPLASVVPGQTVYIRAAVTDPFGSYDITGATLTLRNPSGTIMTPTPIAMSAMTADTPLTATKIFEYLYTVPPAGPTGNWTATVVTTEGTEGIVSDNAQAVMPVLTDATLTVLKTADKGTAKPGDIITYTLLFTNTGGAAASNISVSDVLSPYIAFGTSSYPAEPAPLGPVFDMSGSGTYPTPESPKYFNSSGAEITPTGTYDGAVAKWTIPFTGTLGGGNSFTIKYKTQVK